MSKIPWWSQPKQTGKPYRKKKFGRFKCQPGLYDSQSLVRQHCFLLCCLVPVFSHAGNIVVR